MGSGNSILILDDDPTTLDLFTELFLKEGFYKAMGAVTGKELRHIIKEKEPDIILLDVHIKGEDSIKILKEIKAVNRFLPVVMLADEGSRELAEGAIKFGASSYVIKSSPPSEIVSDIKKELEKYLSSKLTGKISILVIDDDKVTADMVRIFLNTEGHNCLAAYDSKKALSTIRSNKPKLIFLDIVMPGMDGIELLCRIKDIDKGIKVVMMTGIADKDVCMSAILKGASGYIAKPFSMQQLRVAVITALLK